MVEIILGSVCGTRSLGKVGCLCAMFAVSTFIVLNAIWDNKGYLTWGYPNSQKPSRAAYNRPCIPAHVCNNNSHQIHIGCDNQYAVHHILDAQAHSSVCINVTHLVRCTTFLMHRHTAVYA